MQRHLQAIEQSPVTLSVEEIAILGDEQNQSMIEISAIDSDIDRAMSTDAVLEDVKTVVSGIPEIGATEIDLSAAVADMAVAGTDANPEELIGNTSEGVSVESIAETIKNTAARIWEAIKQAIDKVWQAITKFFANIAAIFSPAKRKEEEARAKQAEEERLNKIDEDEKRALYEQYLKQQEADKQHLQAGYFIFRGKVSRLSFDGTNLLPPEKILHGLHDLVDYHKQAIPEIVKHTLQKTHIVLETVKRIQKDPTDIVAQVESMAPNYLKVENDLFHRLGLNLKNDVIYLDGINFSIHKSQDVSMFGLNESKLVSYKNSDTQRGKETKAMAFTMDQGKELLAISKDWRTSITAPELENNIKELERLSGELKKAYDQVVSAYTRPASRPIYRGQEPDDIGEGDQRLKCQKLLAKIIYGLSWTIRLCVDSPILSINSVIAAALEYEDNSSSQRIKMKAAGYKDVYERSKAFHDRMANKS